MTAKKRVLVVFSLVATVLALAVVPFSQASAIDLTMGVTNIWTGARPASVVWWSTDGYTSNTFICGSGVDYRTKVRILEVTYGGGVANYIQKGDIFVLELSATSDNNSNVNIDFARELVDTTGHFEILDIKYSQAGQSAGGIDIYMVATTNNVDSASIERSNGAEWFSMNNTSGVECMNAGNWTVYRASGNGSEAIVNAINNNNSAQTINDAKDAIVGAVNEQRQAQEQANSDANDRYQDEKDTINDSKDEAEASADSMDTSGFNIANPFLNWLGLFTDDACVSIPTMKTWLHSTESNICSPWRNTPVRGVLTPIFSLLGTMLVCGFVFRWLRSNNSEGTIEGI